MPGNGLAIPDYGSSDDGGVGDVGFAFAPKKQEDPEARDYLVFQVLNPGDTESQLFAVVGGKIFGPYENTEFNILVSDVKAYKLEMGLL
jgi:hypothetical protein